MMYMEFHNQVIELLVHFFQDDILKEEPNRNVLDTGLLDSFGTVELLVQIEEQMDLSLFLLGEAVLFPLFIF